MQRADAATLTAFLHGVSRRRMSIAAANGAAIGLVAGALLFAVRPFDSAATAVIVALAAAAIGAIVGITFGRENQYVAAREVERRASECRNVIVTATELAHAENPANSYVSGVVLAEAARMTLALEPTALFPAKRSIVRVAGAAAACAVALVLATAGTSSSLERAPDGTEASIDRVDVVITPPAYTSRPARTMRDPARIEAIAGSRIEISIRARASGVSVEMLSGKSVATRADAGVFRADVLADADGFVALEPTMATGGSGPRRLIGLSVIPDASPRIRVTAPGRDMLVPDTARKIDVTIESSDDFALASLKLRYTKVSGSGEKFTFTEGEVPLAITRDSARAWRGRGTLALSSFGLAQGDMLVYRGIASDARPGATPAESDTYIVEIAAPGGEAAAGFAIDDERDRYGLSQQMVILKTERLIARRTSLSPDSLAVEAMTIAAEQRAVRAEFVFMMGGELAEDVVAAAGLNQLDETREAEAEGDILAGRLANRGRLDLVRAIRSMSRASTELTSKDLPKALEDEKAALVYLQGAFARARYILRALTERERLDLSRRLTGSLVGVLRDARPAPTGVLDERTAALRRVLADVAALAGTSELGGTEAAHAARLGQDVLRVDASSVALHRVADALAAASRSIESRQLSDARRTLGVAASALSASIRTQLPDAPRATRPMELEQLNGALIDALRNPGHAK